MPDKYKDFAALLANEPKGAHAIELKDRGSPLVIAAPHGGGIEPGTSEITRAIAGDDLSYYLFEGLKAQSNHDLHITSSRFDEPKCLGLLKSANIVVTVHGERGEDEIVYLGGRHAVALAALRAKLTASGFIAREHSDLGLQGVDRRNICNIGRAGMGVQLELSRGLRRSFFRALDRPGRAVPIPRLQDFVVCLREVLAAGSFAVAECPSR